MSLIADALQRANRNAIAPDVFRDHDHPWGGDLTAAVVDAPECPPVVETISGVEIGGDPRERDGVAHPWARREPRSPRDPVVLQRSPRGLDGSARQQIAAVVDRVFVPVSGPAPRVVAFASVEVDDLVGWIAATAGETLARQTGARVAVLDLNFAAPSIHECFGLSKTPGLLEAIASDTRFVTCARHVDETLWVIPTGACCGSPALTAASRTRLSHLAATFDHVVMIMEPLAACAAPAIATIADGIVLIIDGERTRRDTGRAAAERLHASGAPILGAVLTNQRYPIPGAIYRRL
jgi:hypothetical protein